MDNITQASVAAANFDPRPYTFKVRPNGGEITSETVVIDLLDWIDADPMADKLQGAIEAGVTAWNKYNSQGRAQEAMSGIAPGGAEMAVGRTGPLDAEQIRAVGEAGRDAVRDAEGGFEAALTAALGHLRTAKELVLELICKCTGKPVEFYKRPGVKTQDIAAMFEIALRVNFIESAEFRGFFAGALNFLRPAPPPVVVPGASSNMSVVESDTPPQSISA